MENLRYVLGCSIVFVWENRRELGCKDWLGLLGEGFVCWVNEFGCYLVGDGEYLKVVVWESYYMSILVGGMENDWDVVVWIKCLRVWFCMILNNVIIYICEYFYKVIEL